MFNDQWYKEAKRRRQCYEGASVLVIVILVVGLVVNIYLRQSETAKRATCSKRLAQLVQALNLYVQDYDGYPIGDKWVSAMMPYVDQLDWFICPSDSGIRMKSKRAYMESAVSYWYTSPFSDSGDTTSVYVFGDRMFSNFIGNHDNGGNVAYLDGHASWASIEKWEKNGLPTQPIVEKKRRGDGASGR